VKSLLHPTPSRFRYPAPRWSSSSFLKRLERDVIREWQVPAAGSAYRQRAQLTERLPEQTALRVTPALFRVITL
jgi:hypothetical protein